MIDVDDGRKLRHWLMQLQEHLVWRDGKLLIKFESGLGPVPFIKRWTEGLVLRCLTETRHRSYTWVMLPQFRLYDGGRTMDLFAISCGEQGGNGYRVGYEIKVSKSDFRSELKKPEKYLETMRYCDEFYYVAPEGVIDPHQLPPRAGLIEVRQDDRQQWLGRWRAKTIVRASKHTGVIDRVLFKAMASAMADRRQRGESPRDTLGPSGLVYDATSVWGADWQAALVDAVQKRVAARRALKKTGLTR